MCNSKEIFTSFHQPHWYECEKKASDETRLEWENKKKQQQEQRVCLTGEWYEISADSNDNDNVYWNVLCIRSTFFPFFYSRTKHHSQRTFLHILAFQTRPFTIKSSRANMKSVFFLNNYYSVFLSPLLAGSFFQCDQRNAFNGKSVIRLPFAIHNII